MLNRVVLTGYLAREIELRQTQGGHTVGRASLAVARKAKDAQGHRPADFIRFVAWDKQAEFLAHYAKKGALLSVEGQLRTRGYDDKEGKHISLLEVVVTDVSFLESKEVFAFRQSQKAHREEDAAPAVDPFAPEAKVDIPEDDLPF
ncbi:single-stranded DNA-binding protein [Lacticaseibacillus jixianensis]|uniref:Single-stranded DNA-binding protein n=1 Tax=Lacticaseibacillus jixianensis TaxID=2486012 RepID=A0ABW4B5L0_9LACO|nr:single-stranded DNA-binding protein [Lacticaseibacillus jixianensis]